jgi:hypothetical protein
MTVHDPEAPEIPAEWLSAFVDVLLPGGDGWPAASMAGIETVLAQRIGEGCGPAALGQLAQAIRSAGGLLEALDETGRIRVVARLERSEPALFGFVRDAAYFAYYETQAVASAINAKGHPYELISHVTGYPTEPFDFERDMPKHGRGRYIATDAVRAVDISGLDLASELTQAWGLKR